LHWNFACLCNYWCSWKYKSAGITCCSLNNFTHVHYPVCAEYRGTFFALQWALIFPQVLLEKKGGGPVFKVETANAPWFAAIV
jgi:hypothetical protein